MPVKINAELCKGCGDCVKECPLGILELVDGKALLKDPDDCVECGYCCTICTITGVINLLQSV